MADDQDQDRFVVHSCHVEDIDVMATTDNGQRVSAKVSGLVIELVPEGTTHGSVTRRYVPTNTDELEALQIKYKVGTHILMPTVVAANQPKPKPDVVVCKTISAATPPNVGVVAPTARQVTAIPVASVVKDAEVTDKIVAATTTSSTVIEPQ